MAQKPPPNPYDAQPEEEETVEEPDVIAEDLEEAEPWRAIVLGATGATGKHVVRQLLASPCCRSVTAVVRSEQSEENMQNLFGASDTTLDKLQQEVVDYEVLEQFKEVFAGYTRAVCCIGAPGNLAGNAQAFHQIDYGHVTTVAQLLKEGGVQHFTLVSAAGADPTAMMAFYRSKGMAEEECKKLNFDRLSIMRPALLQVERKEERKLEWLAQQALKAFDRVLPDKGRLIAAEGLAQSIVKNMARTRQGNVELYKNESLVNGWVGATGELERKKALKKKDEEVEEVAAKVAEAPAAASRACATWFAPAQPKKKKKSDAETEANTDTGDAADKD